MAFIKFLKTNSTASPTELELPYFPYKCFTESSKNLLSVFPLLPLNINILSYDTFKQVVGKTALCPTHVIWKPKVQLIHLF